MTIDIFYKWFKLWEQRTQTKDEDGNIEPRLMIYDGHLSHTGVAVKNDSPEKMTPWSFFTSK